MSFAFGPGPYGQTDPDAGNAPKTFADYARIVEAGLPECERVRMRDAYESLRYANGHFDDLGRAPGSTSSRPVQTSERFVDTGPAGDDDGRYARSRHRLTQPVAKRIVGKLSEHLYKRAPTRALADKKVGDFLADLYQRNGMGPKWQEADRFSIVGGFATFQYAGTDDPRCPLKVHLWSADQVCVWCDPEDHAKYQAVCTLEKVDGRTRLTLWAFDQFQRFTTRRGVSPGEATRKFEPTGDPEPNPYRDPQGKPILPFSFAHHSFPAVEFTTDAPGGNFTELNKYINFGFDDLGDGVRYLTKPIGLAEGVAEDWEAPAVIRPGIFINMAAGQVDEGGNGPTPTLRYLGADNGFVQVIWSHLNNWLDLSMEMENIPPSTVRMVLDARSGVSILAEQAPLLGWTEQRRRPFAHYELKAVETALSVLAAHMRANGHSQTARLDAAALDPGLSLRWPRLYVDLPGPERDRQDGVRLQWGMASLVDLAMERDDLTAEQALEQLKKVKEQNDALLALGIAPLPASLAAPAQGQQQGGGWGGQSLPSDGDTGTGDQIASSGRPGEPGDVGTKADSLSQEGG